MYRSLVLAAFVVPLALGDDDPALTEYSYDYTDAPTTAPTTQTMTVQPECAGLPAAR